MTQAPSPPEYEVRDAVTEADYPDVQGLVFAGWGKRFPFAAFVLVRLAPATAKRWLAAVWPRIRWARPGPDDAVDDAAVQVALAPSGLAALGVPDDVIDRLPQEVKLGMAARARILGDPVDDDGTPVGWELGLDPVDALLLVYARTEDGREALLAEQLALLDAHGGEPVAIERSARWRDREPFGFADGVSQPVIRGQRLDPARGLRAPHDEIAAGEILLGYRNEYGRLPQSPIWGGFDLGKNGTYLVFRKLEQDVAGFWRWFTARGAELAGQHPVPADPRRAAEWLAARAMGRWPNGASTLVTPDEPGPAPAVADVNRFLYLDDDPHGVRCPIGSHVRRANPRDARGGTAAESIKVSNRHRLLRRGRAYGPLLELDDAIAGRDPGGPSGLLFISLQASIARGFEFVQQIWLSNPSFHGLYHEPDPIAGPGGGALTIPASPVRHRLDGLPRFVTPRGGGYFFLPGRAALRRILG